MKTSVSNVVVATVLATLAVALPVVWQKRGCAVVGPQISADGTVIPGSITCGAHVPDSVIGSVDNRTGPAYPSLPDNAASTSTASWIQPSAKNKPPSEDIVYSTIATTVTIDGNTYTYTTDVVQAYTIENTQTTKANTLNGAKSKQTGAPYKPNLQGSRSKSSMSKSTETQSTETSSAPDAETTILTQTQTVVVTASDDFPSATAADVKSTSTSTQSSHSQNQTVHDAKPTSTVSSSNDTDTTSASMS